MPTRITLPKDWKQKSRRAFKRLNKYAAVCFWCGHGYTVYSPELEDDHFAYHCPDAPAALKKQALATLDSQRAQGFLINKKK